MLLSAYLVSSNDDLLFLLEAAPEYPKDMQVKFVPTLGGVHNFLRIHDPLDEDLGQWGHDSTPLTGTVTEESQATHTIPAEVLGFDISEDERTCASERRDHIARQMWEDYQHELEGQ